MTSKAGSALPASPHHAGTAEHGVNGAMRPRYAAAPLTPCSALRFAAETAQRVLKTVL